MKEPHANSPDEPLLAPFERCWDAMVLSWSKTAEDLFHWSARTDFPLADASLFDEWHADPDVRPYVLLGRDEPIAYGEIWIDVADASAELGRLIVAPPHRRQGIGRLLTRRLTMAARGLGCDDVWVRILLTNIAAARCYASVGFVRISPEQEADLNRLQRFRFQWMVQRGCTLRE